MIGREITIAGAMTREDIKRELSRQCEKWGEKSALARRAGIPASLISDVISGRREVNEAIANALGYMVPAFFVPAKGERK